MNFIDHLNQELNQYHLLTHPFYQAWNSGLLSNETLQLYAKEYYHHVAAFPRYVSAVHSSCEELSHRQKLLENLIEEEQGEENHPELWLRFAEGLGCVRAEMNDAPTIAATSKLVQGFFDLTHRSFAYGIGALYAYERQTPAVAQSKIAGLQKFYNVNDERTLRFFTVHSAADEWHSAECAEIIVSLSDVQRQEALEGAISAAKLLWQFLDGIYDIQPKLLN